MNALQDDRLQLNTICTCVALADLNGDGDTKLIVADLGTSRFQFLRLARGRERDREREREQKRT